MVIANKLKFGNLVCINKLHLRISFQRSISNRSLTKIEKSLAVFINFCKWKIGQLRNSKDRKVVRIVSSEISLHKDSQKKNDIIVYTYN